MKNLLILIITFGIISCQDGNHAIYQRDTNFNKLDEKEFLEAARSDSKISPQRISKNFSYKNYYKLLYYNIKNNEYSLSELFNLSRTLTFHCSDKTINSQLDAFKILLNTTQEQSFITDILSHEESFIDSCNKLAEDQLKKLKLVHSFVSKLPNKQMMTSLELIIDIDKLVASKNFSTKNFASFNSEEVNEFILILSNTSDINKITKLIRLHKKISPLTKINRAKILEKTFEGKNGLVIIKNSEIQVISEFLAEYFDAKDEYNQNKLNKILEILNDKIAQKYSSITRFEDVEEILASAWSDYEMVFKIFKSDKITDKRHLISEFGKLNLIIEKIYELPLNRTPAKTFLRSIGGETGKLAPLSSLRLSNAEDRALILENNSILDRESSYDSTIEKLLSLRLKIHEDNSKDAINNYCEFLNQITYNNKNYRKTNNLHDLLDNQNTLGCFELRSFENTLSSEDIKSDKKYLLKINMNKVISSPDLLIKANDIDIVINTDYYNGPIFYLVTKRSRGKRDNPIVDLNAYVSILVLNVTLSENDKIHFPSDKLRLFYNYDLSKAKNAKASEEYLSEVPLKRGFRGGNLTIVTKSTKSIRPMAISLGGEGEIGPDTIFPGLGINSQNIQSLLFMGPNADFYGNMIYSFDGVTFPNLDLSTLKKLKNYAFDTVVNTELTNMIHQDLCANDKRESPLEICYINGGKNKYKKIKSGEFNYLNQVANSELKHAIKILANENLAQQYIGDKFNFPPNISNASGYPTEFGNGANGYKGIVQFILQ